MVYFLKVVKCEGILGKPTLTGIIVEIVKSRSSNRKEKDMRKNTHCFL